ncbi:hypothetical protein [Maridesulfovibrio sp. FT414]|uniref:hypothetical protein n=1 Tax=Maridesulfovibrio sp. FT414 TaxID=2979469 RepID=UPI003D804247
MIVGMGMDVSVFMRVGCAVRMGVFMNMGMVVSMVVAVYRTGCVAVGMLMGSVFVVGSAITGLAHCILLLVMKVDLIL